ncbi:hypothetical protein [Archangium lansingense]|uniref:Peptidase M15A C-terminal domain-containing protein n=1 Tax=Archangium lansingense TaxID=2995310 RepID=A0ABT3ZZH2_9BACT|nr:hypothetical protein [Archangium lansinium]MCY1074804.1 hypothetical protein [Archangium lansinium]
MSKLRAGWLAGVACIGIALGGLSCAKRPASEEATGTGGSGEKAPLGQASAKQGGQEIFLEVLELSVGKPEKDEASRTSFVTGEPISTRGRVRNAKELESRIQWHLQPVGPQTADADPTTHEGQDAVFRAFSRVGTAGSRQPNPPLEYELVASVLLENGEVLQVRLPPTTFLRQDLEDVLRQEYVDFGTSFRPSRTQLSIPGRRTFNTGNYTVIAEEDAGGLAHLLEQLDGKIRALLNNDVQEKPVGTRGLSPGTVVVSPGGAILEVGALGDTDPQGDDLCAGPRVGNRCTGSILAGPNGTADTRANNRELTWKLEDFVSSAFRNPQRNRAAGSVVINSHHTRGRALDLDPRRMPVPGKTPQQLMCIVEAAGDAVVGERDSFTERGATRFLDCNDPMADHVHVER